MYLSVTINNSSTALVISHTRRVIDSNIPWDNLPTPSLAEPHSFLISPSIPILVDKNDLPTSSRTDSSLSLFANFEISQQHQWEPQANDLLDSVRATRSAFRVDNQGIPGHRRTNSSRSSPSLVHFGPPRAPPAASAVADVNITCRSGCQLIRYSGHR